MCACAEVLTYPLVTKVCAGSRIVRLYISMKLIFIYSETEILLKKKTPKKHGRQVYQLQFLHLVVDTRG